MQTGRDIGQRGCFDQFDASSGTLMERTRVRVARLLRVISRAENKQKKKTDLLVIQSEDNSEKLQGLSSAVVSLMVLTRMKIGL